MYWICLTREELERAIDALNSTYPDGVATDKEQEAWEKDQAVATKLEFLRDHENLEHPTLQIMNEIAHTGIKLWLERQEENMPYTWECPECKQKTLICYDSLDRTKTICDCGNCGYHSETSLDEIEDEEEPEDEHI